MTRADEGEGREYVLIKRGLYWRPNGQGYTGLLSEAGRYSAAEAAAHADHDNDSTRSWPADEAGEFAPSCWQETMLAFRTKERDAANERAAQAETEVARLTAALAEAERERDEGKAILLSIAAVVEPPLEDGIWSGTVLEAVEASEASASALRERVATLEAALQPFATYAADMPGADFGEGEIGEYYHEGFRRSIRTQDLRAARTALEAPHADN